MDGLASRYALALLKLALDDKAVSVYKEWLTAIDKTAETEPDLIDYLQSAFVPESDKDALIERLCAGAPAYGANFLKLLVAKKRVLYLHPIKKEFVRLANDVLGVRQGVVYTREPLSEKELAAISDTLARKLKTDVELHNEIDDRLLGGFKITIQGQSFDYSMNEKLRLLSKQMLERGDAHAD